MRSLGLKLINRSGCLETLGFGEGRRSQLRGIGGAVFDEGFHRADEVFVEWQAVALAVLDQGVGNAAEFTPPTGAEKQVVPGSDFQGADGNE